MTTLTTVPVSVCPSPAVLSRHRGVDVTGLDFVVVDVETTGFCAVSERVIEVAVVRVRDGEVIDEFSTLVDPGRPVHNTEIHGITTPDVSSAPTWAQLAPTLLSHLSGAVMVCHHAAFDYPFLSQEFRRVEIDIAAIPTLCTLVTARSQLDLRDYKLSAVVERITGIWPDYEHTALGDARATTRLLRGFLYDTPDKLLLSASTPQIWHTTNAPVVSTQHRVMVDQNRWDLVHLIEQLPMSRIPRAVDVDALDRYRAALDLYSAALRLAKDDRKIELEEVWELGELIRCGGLTRAAVEQVHRDQNRLEVDEPIYPIYRREPIVRWVKYWRPYELHSEINPTNPLVGAGSEGRSGRAGLTPDPG